MKALTIEELRALSIDDGVYIQDRNDEERLYCKFFGIENNVVMFDGGTKIWSIDQYGINWIAYRFEEQFEKDQTCIPTPQMIAEGDCNGNCSDCEGRSLCYGNRIKTSDEVKKYIEILKELISSEDILKSYEKAIVNSYIQEAVDCFNKFVDKPKCHCNKSCIDCNADAHMEGNCDNCPLFYSGERK